MEFLITKTALEFGLYTIPWKEHFKPFLNDYEKEIKSGTYAGRHKDVNAYGKTFLSWPIRKLEYSYILNETLNHIFSGCKTLDCGCGVVPLPRVYKKMGCEAYACDNDLVTINILRQAKYISEKTINYSVQDITRLDFPSDTFDLVTCVSVLEHLPPGLDSLAISEMLRVLKRGGRLVCTIDFEPYYSSSPIHSILQSVLTGQLFFRTFWLLKEEPVRLLRKTTTILKSDRKTEVYQMASFNERIFNPFSKHMLGPIPSLVPSAEDIHDFWKEFWKPAAQGSPGLSLPNYISLGFVIEK
jgi:ubiquinone/menaquinone biosynthesis C-methylase UbiE